MNVNTDTPPKRPDLKQEQAASLNRPRYQYSIAARIFFKTMDILAGSKTTLAKAKLVEILASIPYREWEIKQYKRMTRCYRKEGTVDESRNIVIWGREAQDNEYTHLLVIQEKTKEEGIADPWYLAFPVPQLMVIFYRIFARMLVFFSLRRALLFNAEFEDHAEHVYAELVWDNPDWENENADNSLVLGYTGDIMSWADVFRRIGLDERDHMNRSFLLAGKPEHVVKYGYVMDQKIKKK